MREYASPELANLIAARISSEEFDRRARAPLSEAEAQDIADLYHWFTRRYPTAKERLAYARRKFRQYSTAGRAPSVDVDYFETAKRLANAHRAADPATELVMLAPDPERKELRLLEVTRSAPTTGFPFEVGFAARPDRAVPFSLTLVLLNPEEWADAKAGRLTLPASFCRSSLTEI